MHFLISAFRTSRRHALKTHVVAAVVTAILPPAIAALYLWLFPGGCDLRGDPAVYRWTCLFPGLLITVPTFVALLLVVIASLRHRLGWRLPDGWLLAPVVSGLLIQVVLVGGYMLILGPGYRALFLGEVISIPQPFLAGATAGVIYVVMLRLTAGMTEDGQQTS